MSSYLKWINGALAAGFCIALVACTPKPEPPKDQSSSPPAAVARKNPYKGWKIRLGIKDKGKTDVPVIESHSGNYMGKDADCSEVDQKDSKGGYRCFISFDDVKGRGLPKIRWARNVDHDEVFDDTNFCKVKKVKRGGGAKEDTDDESDDNKWCEVQLGCKNGTVEGPSLAKYCSYTYTISGLKDPEILIQDGVEPPSSNRPPDKTPQREDQKQPPSK